MDSQTINIESTTTTMKLRKMEIESTTTNMKVKKIEDEERGKWKKDVDGGKEEVEGGVGRSKQDGWRRRGRWDLWMLIEGSIALLPGRTVQR